jgi:hypothetical protein
MRRDNQCRAVHETPPEPAGRYTTIMTFESPDLYQWEGTEISGLKATAFEPNIGLPRRLGAIFELEAPSRHCRNCARPDGSWPILMRLPMILGVTRHSIGALKQSSALPRRDTSLRTPAGSAREARVYLASGRRVIAQDTGFSDCLPCGAGLFAFRSVNDIAAAVAELDAHYEAHCRSAPIGLLIGFKPTDT